MVGRDPLALIRTAHRDGSGGPTRDRIFIGSCSVAVLDGASPTDAAGLDRRPTGWTGVDRAERDGAHLDGGWLADQLGVELMRRLETRPHMDLGDALTDAVSALASCGASQGHALSTMVSVARWSARDVEVLVVGGSPVIVRHHDGALDVVRDVRRGSLDGLVGRAVRAHWPAAELDCVLLVTDGAADGVDVYGVPPDWPTAVTLAIDDPQAFLDTVHTAETSESVDGGRPHAGRHRDKALAVIQFPTP